MSNHRDILRRIRLAFPQPVSDRIHDAYFSHLVHHALDRVDDMKGDSPFLGRRGQVDYEAAQARCFPEAMSEAEEVIEEVVAYLEGISIWGHPHTQENVLPPTTIPSIVGMMVAAIYNPNVIWDEYSHRLAEAEVEVTSMIAGLVGYDPHRAGGVFTFGGTGTILYGAKVGLCKALPQSMIEGVREDVKIICSDASHYSKLNVAAWLGIGAKNIVEVPTSRKNAMEPEALETILDGILGAGQKVAAIVATMGTTDAFGLDPLEDIVAVRDRVAAQHGVTPPHLHADAVIGWPWAVFDDYDFDANPLQFGARTLRSLGDSRVHIRHLHLADSLGVDFHKTGYSPYTSSLFMVRERRDFELLSRDQKQMPYLYQFGEYHPGVYTLECSRNGGAILAALANLKLLGKEGYRVLLGHVVEMAERLREQFEQAPAIDVLNDYNHGPVILFRVYPPGTDAAEATRQEMSEAAAVGELRAHNDYCRQVFARVHQEVLSGRGVNIGLTDRYRCTEYGEPMVALKSFIMSPFIDEEAVDLVIERVQAAQQALRGGK
jgi:glutamate/tyrosine decarboxylase-like PLP-dependent enzyme